MNHGLKIETYVLGMVQTNCYLIYHEETKEAIIIDPADNAKLIGEKIRQKNLDLCGILLTHGHFDHIMGAEELKEMFRTKIYAHKEEAELLRQPELNYSAKVGNSIAFSPDIELKDHEVLEMAGFQIQVLPTPGHTKGGACYYFEDEKVLISGDTLFFESVGRTDLPTGSMSTLIRSIKEELLNLEDDVMVYPGHGESTTIGYERKNNPYITV